ncbi:Protein LURP1 [Madurella mycetomatis]|uniref:Protein LURP1 n=1 Tax=Madurella mycetomatis TaxID=100816 RepID=A0A175VZ71_9PEZI|nr:Protein LURP1 [Madurella mycetomatis]
MASYQLAPLPQKLAIFDGFVEQGKSVTLVLKDRMRRQFDIKTLDGAQVLHVKGPLFTLHRRKTVHDTAGNHLFEITYKPSLIHSIFSIEDPSGRQLMEVKNESASKSPTLRIIVASVSIRIRATFVNTSTGQPVSLFMKRSPFDTSTEIIDEATGAVVARIDRKLINGRKQIVGRRTYHLTVAPGADLALLAAMCICLDERKHER